MSEEGQRQLRCTAWLLLLIILRHKLVMRILQDGGAILLDPAIRHGAGSRGDGAAVGH